MSRIIPQKFSFLSIIILLGIFILDISPKPVEAACSTCRVYSITYLSDQQYKAVHAFIEYANPNINDAYNGFSAEVIWIGDIQHGKTIEVGWRQNGGLAGENQYWGYFDTGGWHGFNLSGNYTGHDYQIEYKSDGYWHVSIDGNEKGSVSASTVGYTSGFIQAGAESTDYSSTAHNAVGVSGFLNLTFKRPTDTGYISWSGMAPPYNDYDYWLHILASNKFQNGGHN